MNLWFAARIAYKALKSYKIRSILTTLGIIIGVAAVIILISMTQGAKLMIEEQLTGLGGKSLIINQIKGTQSGIRSNASANPLTAEDAEAIRGLNIVTHVSPLLNTKGQVVWGNRNWFTKLVGTSPDFIFINDWFTERGNYFNDRDVENSERVCVIGKTVAKNLFGYQNPVGENIRMGKFSFRVIGVMSSIGHTPGGHDEDDVIFIPYTTIQNSIMGVPNVESISVSVSTPNDVPFAQEIITRLLRDRHNIRPNGADDFYVRTQLTHIERIFTISKIMTILLGSIASISLIVGGIGIMNIMLVSVGERTREIGIRMAVGAKERDILIQFMIEAVLLSVVGGIIGVILGIAASKISSSFTNWPAVVSITSIFIAFGFAAMIGIFFGIYPARKASKLDPIEALRYE
ncbi:ABC transporter permease [Desulfobacterota bacterium AH_259_B03_O07]|nr:ABC transporter permease [Desulfobacterota bacterium AH_259_B03_O07]